MKTMMQVVAVVALVGSLAVDAFAPRSAFVGHNQKSSLKQHSLRMDYEQLDSYDLSKTRFHLDQLFQDSYDDLSYFPSSRRMTVDEAEAVHGMPWKASIDPKVADKELLYMKFWEWQMAFMKENLTNLRVESCSNGQTDFAYQENPTKKARIVNLCFSSNEYRKIRMTYYDAGDATQVFNAVWYPDPKYNLPVLGIDVLAFNRKKYLAIVDFQPLHDKEQDHAVCYETDLLKPIKDKYESLKGRMSSKFYDETKFFSQQMLFSRFEDESIIHRELFPAFQEYVAAHTKLVQDTQPDYENTDVVMKRQQAYDTYSAARDPATGLFCAMFGQEWATDYVYDFLFNLSDNKPKTLTKTASSPGGTVPAQQRQTSGGNPYATQPSRRVEAVPVGVLQ